MSYQGGVNYMPVDTVDESADFTDMQGQASALNMTQGKPKWFDSPTKSLVALWVFILLVYSLFGFFFRRYLA